MAGAAAVAYCSANLRDGFCVFREPDNLPEVWARHIVKGPMHRKKSLPVDYP